MEELRLRKFSPIDKDWPIFEVLIADVVLFDVTKNDAGELELGFHSSGKGRLIPLTAVLASIEEVKRLLIDYP